MVPNNSSERAFSPPSRRAWPLAGMLAATRGKPSRQAAQFNRQTPVIRSSVLLMALVTSQSSHADAVDTPALAIPRARTATTTSNAPAADTDVAGSKEESPEMKKLRDDIERMQRLYSKFPKRKFISAATRQPEYAAYMAGLVRTIEEVGNKNYPEEARRLGLSGRVILTISIARNGEIVGVQVMRASGNELLDSAAVSIVRLCKKFQPLPVTDENIDILEVTRTFSFVGSGPIPAASTPSTPSASKAN